MNQLSDNMSGLLLLSRYAKMEEFFVKEGLDCEAGL